jgi:sporulation protein YlmC with PRC-barrel domain
MRARYHLVGGIIAAALLSSTAMAQTSTPAPAPSAKTQDVIKGTHWRASKMSGLNVYNDANEKIGDIKEIILDKDSKVIGYVIGVGGFLGMGEHDVLVDAGKIKFVNEPVRSTSNTNAPTNTKNVSNTSARSANEQWYPDHAVFNATKEQLKAMPAFKYS